MPSAYIHRLFAFAAMAISACKDESVVVPPPVDAAFASTSAGLLHTCGVTVTSHVYCWGWNRDGEVGDGSQTDRVYAVRVGGALTFGAVSLGGGHSCAVTTGNVPYCWGLNLTGQIGDGSTTSQSTPVGVFGGLAFATVASGSGATHTCAIAAPDSTARCWGWARYGQLGSRTGETCALGVDSIAYCWGHNDAGQLGTGTTVDTAGPVAVSGGLHFARLTLGFSHSCGLTAGGDAYCWGDNTFGQIGDTTRSQSSVPVHVVGGVIFTTLSAGSEHTCGVSTGNVAWCWGQNGSSELGAESSETCTTPTGVAISCSRRPLGVTTSQNFRSISSGGHFTCALTTNGKAYCWGNNSNGQLGTGNTSGSSLPVLVANQP